MSKAENNTRRILVVDDDPDNREVISQALTWQGYDVTTADCGEDGLAKLSSVNPHLVLLDVNMPGISGLETLRQVRQNSEYVSVILVTGQSATDDVIRGLDAGADDYIVKPFNPTELLARVRAQLRIKDLNDQLKAANARLQDLVDHDDLTGLFNMRNLYQKLDMELARGRRYGRSVAVVMMDMDNFKTANDHHDHLFGSHVLAEVGRLVRENIRQMDFGARYGGDEFLVVLSETSVEGALLFGERMRSVIESFEFSDGEHRFALTASLGIAVVSPSHTAIDARALVRAADHALYAAKDSGKNCIKMEDLPPDVATVDLKVLRKSS